MNIILGIDTGGTFTDFVLFHEGRLQTHKVLSTPHAPEQAILKGMNELGLNVLPDAAEFYIVHGSTVATNAVLEGKGVKTVFITNHGLGDMLSIARQTRPELYNLQPVPVKPPVARKYCLETGGRLAASGETVDDLSDADIALLLQQVQALKPRAVAINLLFSYLDSHFEKAIEEALSALPLELFISRSSAILPEFKEYERGITTWLNAYVGPLVQGYLARLQQGARQAQISVMQSSGGTIAADQAGMQAVHMLLSGPAGGLAGAKFIGKLAAYERLLTFDMGGTSTDVAMIDGELQLTNEGRIAGYPVAVPMVDMHTIGAGGGSLAHIDPGGMLQVGPESAGAAPGPACYGQGGTKPTVTDANLVLGRLRADAFMGGKMPLDQQAARDAIQTLAVPLNMTIEEVAQGMVQIANEHMAHALRVMSVQRGIDPRELTLVSFGGAGGLHVCALAEALDMNKALVPIHAGVLSALGMLVAPKERQLSRSRIELLAQVAIDELQGEFDRLIDKGRVELIKEGVKTDTIQIRQSLDLRYQGQSYYLNIAVSETIDEQLRQQASTDFHQLHEARYGHQLNLPVELVNLRVGLKSPAQALQLKTENHQSTKEQPQQNIQHVELVGIESTVPVYARAQLITGKILTGPLLITETVSTTFIAPGWQCETDGVGNLLLNRL